MDFTKDLLTFPSEAHKVIFYAAREMTEPSRSLCEITDKSLRESCEQYYAFLMELFSDMYENPEVYEIPVLSLETFLDGQKLNGMKQKYPSKTKSLIAVTRNCAERYIQTLARMAYEGELQGDRLMLTKEKLAAIEKAVNTSTSPISLKKRLEAFSHAGLCSAANEKDEGTLEFFHEKYPKLFPAMIALAKKTNGVYSGFPFYLFTKTDFRNIPQDYKPTAEDYIAPLPAERREIALTLHKLALSLGCKVDITTFMKVNYKYKGGQVLLMDTKDGDLDIRITEVYSWDDRTFFMNKLLSEPAERQKTADRRLWRCSACATSHVGQKIEFLGRHNRVCGGGMIGFTWRNAKKGDGDDLAFFLKTRCEFIDDMRKNGKKIKNS